MYRVLFVSYEGITRTSAAIQGDIKLQSLIFLGIYLGMSETSMGQPKTKNMTTRLERIMIVT